VADGVTVIWKLFPGLLLAIIALSALEIALGALEIALGERHKALSELEIALHASFAELLIPISYQPRPGCVVLAGFL
jgi:hypothetical protein